LTEPTLLEMSGNPTYQDFEPLIVVVCSFRVVANEHERD
jgi:hypothetical protein